MGTEDLVTSTEERQSVVFNGILDTGMCGLVGVSRLRIHRALPERSLVL